MATSPRLVVAAASLALLPACPFLSSLQPPADAGVADDDVDAGPSGPKASDATGSVQVVVRDDAGDVVCDAAVTVPELPGFTGLVAMLADDDESAFTINFGPFSDEADKPTEPPIAMLQIIGRFPGQPDVQPTGVDTVTVALADLSELNNIGGCNGGALIGALSTTTAFDVTFSELIGEQQASNVDPCPNPEVNGPCTITEGTIRSQGSTTFTVEGGSVDVTFDFVSYALWAVGDQS